MSPPPSRILGAVALAASALGVTSCRPPPPAPDTPPPPAATPTENEPPARVTALETPPAPPTTAAPWTPARPIIEEPGTYLGRFAEALAPQHLTVQLKAVPSATDATAIATQLRAEGWPARITRADLGDRGVWYRLRMGRFAADGLARMAADSLAAEPTAAAALAAGDTPVPPYFTREESDALPSQAVEQALAQAFAPENTKPRAVVFDDFDGDNAADAAAFTASGLRAAIVLSRAPAKVMWAAIPQPQCRGCPAPGDPAATGVAGFGDFLQLGRPIAVFRTGTHGHTEWSWYRVAGEALERFWTVPVSSWANAGPDSPAVERWFRFQRIATTLPRVIVAEATYRNVWEGDLCALWRETEHVIFFDHERPPWVAPLPDEAPATPAPISQVRELFAAALRRRDHVLASAAVQALLKEGGVTAKPQLEALLEQLDLEGALVPRVRVLAGALATSPALRAGMTEALIGDMAEVVAQNHLVRRTPCDEAPLARNYTHGNPGFDEAGYLNKIKYLAIPSRLPMIFYVNVSLALGGDTRASAAVLKKWLDMLSREAPGQVEQAAHAWRLNR